MKKILSVLTKPHGDFFNILRYNIDKNVMYGLEIQHYDGTILRMKGDIYAEDLAEELRNFLNEWLGK